jgi:hypothetical protein
MASEHHDVPNGKEVGKVTHVEVVRVLAVKAAEPPTKQREVDEDPSGASPSQAGATRELADLHDGVPRPKQRSHRRFAGPGGAGQGHGG